VNLTYLPFIREGGHRRAEDSPQHQRQLTTRRPRRSPNYEAEHLGFAVDTEQGLLSPVIHNAGDLSLAGLARAIADIAARTRSGNLKPDELSGGTFTITNIGSQGALFDTPILVPSAGRDVGNRRHRQTGPGGRRRTAQRSIGSDRSAICRHL